MLEVDVFKIIDCKKLYGLSILYEYDCDMDWVGFYFGFVVVEGLVVVV